MKYLNEESPLRTARKTFNEQIRI